MSDQKKKPQAKKNIVKKMPPQKGPTDTSNWDDRVFKAPDGTLIIETDQTTDNSKTVHE